MSNDDRTGTPGNEPRIPDPLPSAIGTRIITCSHCKQQFTPSANLGSVQCPYCSTWIKLATPTFTRSA